MLSVQTNTAAVTALKNLNINSKAQNMSLNHLSSGFRVNTASDDAAGFAIASKLDAFTGRLKAANLNATQATAMVKTADAALNEIQNIIVRIQSLAVQASSANNANDLTKLDAERKVLEGQIDKFAATAEYNGTKLLDGSQTTAVAFQVGAANTANDRITVDLTVNFNSTVATSSGGLGLKGSAATALTSQTGAQAYITTLDTALTNVLKQRSALGAAQNQLGFVQANLATAIEQSTASVSAIKDADMAAEMANFTKNKILTQAGTSMLAQANQAAQNVLTLFR